MRERDEFEAWAKSRFYLDQIGGESEQADEYAFDTTDAAWKAWQAARAPQAVPALTAKQRYDEFMEPGEEPSPIERLRFFCSLAMSGQDWLDVEPFFDDLLAASQPSPEPKGPK